MKKFIKENLSTILLVIVLLMFFKGCGDSQRFIRMDKHLRHNDSINIELLRENKELLKTIIPENKDIINRGIREIEDLLMLEDNMARQTLLLNKIRQEQQKQNEVKTLDK